MVARGHGRTAVECRTKMKSLRSEYRKVVAASAKSGSDRKTCPYFDELDKILHGDVDIRPCRVTQTTKRRRPNSQSSGDHGDEPSQFIVLFSEAETSEIDALSAGGHTGGDVEDEDDDETQIDHLPMSEGTVTLHLTEVTEEEEMRSGEGREGDGGDSQAAPSTPSKNSSCGEERDPDNIPPGTLMSELTPRTRLAVMRARKKRVSALQKVGENLAKEASRENRALMQSAREEHQELLEELRASRHAEDVSRESMQGFMKAAATSLSDISKTLVPLVQLMAARQLSFSGSDTMAAEKSTLPAIGGDGDIGGGVHCNDAVAPNPGTSHRVRRQPKRRNAYTPTK
ncbi:zinc finger and SCAN domain-containing protein 29-like [Heteronotia binoei]|uniref:zinc finger and SCAN domain-containing protein 29-like n=1 Tax=Heteronotia binoei TaxID=13085 RepID=UPI00292ECD96|nr:zinc finger and SCAN domain-containing protein 29-like [Heteronotia binoei]